jgi:hypothetical protein
MSFVWHSVNFPNCGWQCTFRWSPDLWPSSIRLETKALDPKHGLAHLFLIWY